MNSDVDPALVEVTTERLIREIARRFDVAAVIASRSLDQNHETSSFVLRVKGSAFACLGLMRVAHEEISDDVRRTIEGGRIE